MTDSALLANLSCRRPFLESPETLQVFFEWHNSLDIFRIKASQGTKLSSYWNFYSLYNIWKDQLQRTSKSEFYERLFVPGKAFCIFEKRAPEKEVFPFQGIKRDRFQFSNTLQRKDARFPVQIYKRFFMGWCWKAVSVCWETQKVRVRESKRNIIRETTEGDGKDYHQAVFDVSNASPCSHGWCNDYWVKG